MEKCTVSILDDEKSINTVFDEIRNNVKKLLVNNKNNDKIDEGLNIHRLAISYQKEIKSDIQKIKDLIENINQIVKTINEMNETFNESQ